MKKRKIKRTREKLQELYRMQKRCMERNLRGKLDTAGYPVKRIDKWLSRDIDEAVELTVEELK
jgi:hypothetical protein